MNWLRTNVLNWRSATFFLGAVFFWNWAFPFAYRLVVSPASYLEVSTVYVPSAHVGQSPTVALDREIRRSFTGSIATTVRRIDEGEGTIWTYCDGERHDMPYVAGRAYPGRDLNWWLGSPPDEECNLTPGKYQLRIDWTIYGFFGLVPLYETRESAPFTVYDPAQAYLPTQP